MNKGEETIQKKQPQNSYKKILKQIKENKPNVGNIVKTTPHFSGELLTKIEKI